MKKNVLFIMVASLMLMMAGCSTDADIASHNISKAADMFQINRRIVFFNGITDKYLLVIEGRCSVDVRPDKVITVTCKTGENDYKKHYLGLSDNVSWFGEQLDDSAVSTYRYKVIFKPSAIIPDIDLSK
jgi:hypothetical protein